MNDHHINPVRGYSKTELRAAARGQDRTTIQQRETSGRVGDMLHHGQSYTGGYSSSPLLGLILLGELSQDGDGLSDLEVQGIRSLKEVEQLGVVHLEKHTGDLASELGLGAKRGK